MSELARDPVFGEVARRLAPHRNSAGHIVFRAGSIPGRELATLVEHGLHIDHAVLSGAWPEQAIVSFDRESLARAAESSPCAEALLAASDACEVAHSTPRSPIRIQGIVNVTPDSFSDGGQFRDPSRAVEHGLALVDEGADLLDVGGESTRPGSEPVALAEELERVIPVIHELARATRVPISVDTQKAAVARAALDAGATIVNDVSAGLADREMFAVVAERRAGYVAMHMRGDPRTMQIGPKYLDVCVEVLEFLRERCLRALEAGVPRETLWIDPGIGFGKRVADNLELLRGLRTLQALGLPILIGVSRKAFIVNITGLDTPPLHRIGGTAAALTIGVLNGANILRVHDVAVMREAASVAERLARAFGPRD